ncbi:MAG: hypothetical protein PF448_05575 [Bacteroidales bacterium]|jgi:hypothetical protein|nr:hypothetical protein [Bacteroidales bacterium]
MKKLGLFMLTVLISGAVFSQDFEAPQKDGEDFNKVDVRLGADFSLQFQALNHHADSALIPLGNGINLPTANLIVGADLAPGIEVNLTTYLSSRHHVEAWVKGGYLIIDEMQFFNSEIVNKAMDKLTFKAGVMELDYGDAHYRRSDNGNVINNPFVGNYIMDAFTTAPAFEAMFRHEGLLVMAGVNTGSLKPALVGYSGYTNDYTPYNIGDELAYHFKAGYDKELFTDFRLRATLSAFLSNNHHFGSLYYGDRTGSRYYLIMNKQNFSSDDVDPSSGHMSGRWTPGFTDKNHAYMANLFTKYKGIELFATYETSSGTSAFGGSEYQFNQIAIEGLYRFGKDEQFFAGGRYNTVSNSDDMSVDRYQAIAGWYMTNNVKLKLEYVQQTYNNFSEYGSDAGFDGVMFEAAISF